MAFIGKKRGIVALDSDLTATKRPSAAPLWDDAVEYVAAGLRWDR